jgi:hypothetical protein
MAEFRFGRFAHQPAAALKICVKLLLPPMIGMNKPDGYSLFQLAHFVCAIDVVLQMGTPDVKASL